MSVVDANVLVLNLDYQPLNVCNVKRAVVLLSKQKAVVVEQKTGNWRRIAVPLVDRYGIFSGRIENVKGSGSLRARLATGKDFSQPFSLKVVKDFRFCPWGSFC